MGKRLIALLMAVTMVAAPVGVNAETSTIKYRGYDWGTPREEILKNEIEPGMVEDEDYSIDSEGLFRFYSDVAGYDMAAMYEFDDNDELYKGYYGLNENHSNDTQYYYDFVDLAEKFTILYGEPSDKQEIWYDDLYKDDPSDWGMSFATGRSKFIYTWTDGEDNTLKLLIMGDNYEVNVAIFYYKAGTLENNQPNTNGL